MEEITPVTIWNSKQNHPEYVVRDCQIEFGLTEEQCEKLRFILMNRGVNKWLYARRKFIALKHDIKRMMKEADKKSDSYYILCHINESMQNISKMPRWIEWNKHIHRKMKKNEQEVIVKGKRC